MIEQMLDQLAEYRNAIEAQRTALELAKHAAIPDEVAARLAEIDEEFRPAIEASEAAASELESKIRAAVIDRGSTVKGRYLAAQYSVGRVTWETKMLDGMAAFYPEIYMARKQGRPFVTLAKI